MSSNRFLITLFTFLVAGCMLVSCVVPVNSNQEAIMRLKAEVAKVNQISQTLASNDLRKDQIAGLAQDGINSEHVQNADRLWLAQHQIKNARISKSMDVYNDILHKINAIITIFKEMLKKGVTIDDAHQKIARIAQIRSVAKPLNAKLMDNAGYNGP
ncbi:uncharacterized protein MELLADRAFT_101569 [Melampsora larici-populina 98AG31]|uniref:Secreted protein n=1 Tax=Melampsora larici-populina (strain 98AG31 / pathotype 3-4-7) TaxID=747676 RepID=F4R698_MELLP|nr:uncharacterized protein MELLADRAFT_101569 [Melampsora larici-populina 98AG31]EGG11844.1 secreted protein [Melampsora larici-populina 98AG31]